MQNANHPGYQPGFSISMRYAAYAWQRMHALHQRGMSDHPAVTFQSVLASLTHFGRLSGALDGLETRLWEFAYDTSRSVMETNTGQWGILIIQ